MNTRLTRRSALWLGWAPFVRAVRSSAAVTAGPNQFPRPGDLLVSQAGSRAGAVINPGDIAPGQPPLRAWAMDPDSRALRDRSFFDQILLVRLDPATLTAAEVPLAANGIVGYSAICTHAGCVVVGWKPAERQLLCPCHGSVYDPAACGRVIAGPAPRPLPALPLRINDGVLTVAAEFTARIGGSTGRTD